MPRGHPDWGQYAATTTIGGLNDLGEAVARLGAIGLWDRRGQVLWWDDFEMGLQKWSATGPLLGGSASWSTDTARIGRYCAKLVAPSDGAGNAGLTVLVPFEIRSRIGFEVAYTIEHWTSFFEFLVTLIEIPNSWNFGIRANRSTQSLEYYGGDGLWHDSGSAARFYVTGNWFNVMKFVVDFSDVSYVRLISNGLQSAMGQGLNSPAKPTHPQVVRIDLKHQGTAGHNALSYVDDVILTINEP